MRIHSIGIDLGKTTFHLVALGAAGKVLVERKFTREQLLAYTANLQTSLIGLEACSGAHYLDRALRKQGQDVRLIAARFVKPFVNLPKAYFFGQKACDANCLNRRVRSCYTSEQSGSKETGRPPGLVGELNISGS